MQKTLVAALFAALALTACGGPAPLSPDPSYRAEEGPSVQFHASQANGNFVIDGVAQGVTEFKVRHLREGQLLRTGAMPVQNSRFAGEFGPVQNGDLITIESGTYHCSFVMKFPWGVTSRLY
jgi:hypothetical protein